MNYQWIIGGAMTVLACPLSVVASPPGLHVEIPTGITIRDQVASSKEKVVSFENRPDEELMRAFLTTNNLPSPCASGMKSFTDSIRTTPSVYSPKLKDSEKLAHLMFLEAEHVLIDFQDIKDEDLAVIGLALRSSTETIKILELRNIEDRHVKFLTMKDKAGGENAYNYILETMPEGLVVKVEITTSEDQENSEYLQALIIKLKDMGHEVTVKRKMKN